MKLFLTAVLFLSTLAAQTVDSSPRAMAVFTVGTLPTASSWTNKTALVTDGSAAGDCTTGSGSTRVLCVSNGSVWAAVAGGGGGGGATNTTPSICPGGCGATYSASLAGTANTLYVWLINIPGPTQVAKMLYYTTTSTNQAWAIYSANGSSSALLATGGHTAGCGGCSPAVALAYTFPAAGSYYLAFSGDATTTSIGVSASTWPVPTGSITSPLIATAANTVTWAAGVPTFPGTTGALTWVTSFGYPFGLLTY